MNQPLRAAPREIPRAESNVDEIAAFDALRTRRAAMRKFANGGDRERRYRFRWALLAALFLHGLLYLGVRQWSLPNPEFIPDTGVIHLRLIDRSAPEPQPDVPSVPLIERPAVVVAAVAPTVATPTKDVTMRPESAHPVQDTPARWVQEAEPDSGRETGALLFDKNGRALLPTPPATDPAVFGSRKRAAEFAPDPMAHESPLPYKPTPFDRYWKPDGETLLGEWVRKATKESSYDTKHGTRVTCKAFLFLMACGWGPTPRVSIEELKAMRVDPPGPRARAEDPYLAPIP